MQELEVWLVLVAHYDKVTKPTEESLEQGRNQLKVVVSQTNSFCGLMLQ